MNNQELLKNNDYDPNRFIDLLIEALAVRNDAQLSRKLTLNPPVISKVRHRVLPVGDAMLVRVSDLAGLSTRDIKAWMFRPGAPSTEDQRAQSWEAMRAAAQKDPT